MSLQESFITDIAENAEDETPRLVFADWLDEHGRGDHAELIRVQCELARLGEDAEPDRRALLQGRERQLLARCAKGAAGRWLRQSLPGGNGGPAWQLRRGAVEHVSLAVPRLLDIGREIFRTCPIRSLRLTDLGRLGELATWPQLARVRELELVGDLRPEQATRFFRSPHLGPLGALRLRTGEPSAECWSVLSDSRALEGLETLSLGFPGPYWYRWQRLTPEQVLAAPVLRGLRRLELGVSWPAAFTALRQAPQAGSLRELSFSRATVRLHPGAATTLGAVAAALPRWLRPAGAAPEALLGPLLSGLRSFSLRGCLVLGTLSLNDFLALPALANLRRLDLSELLGSSPPPRCNHPHLAALEELHLARTRLDNAELAALAGAVAPPRLLTLDLSDNALTGEVVPALLGSRRLAGLRWLSLANNFLHEGLPALIDSDLLPRLCWLDLRGTGLTDEVALRFAARTRELPLLSWLDLRGNPLSRAVCLRLREALGPAVRYTRG